MIGKSFGYKNNTKYKPYSKNDYVTTYFSVQVWKGWGIFKLLVLGYFTSTIPQARVAVVVLVDGHVRED